MKPVCDRLAEARLVLAVGSTALNSDERRQMTELKMLAESLGLSDRVIFRGYVPDDELANLYRSADVFALSSRYEPFGMTAIEAMACGVPTIVTTEGGLWAQVKWGTETLYANPNDPEAFGHSILDILQYPEIARQLSMYGSARVRSEFTWSKIAQDFLNLCNDAATRPQNDEFDSVAGSRYHDQLQVSS
jgi:mannosylfructose-phosphate synthase